MRSNFLFCRARTLSDLKTGAVHTLLRAENPRRRRFSWIARAALRDTSTNKASAAPRLKASRDTFPVPAKRSRILHPDSSWGRILKSASLTLAEVGRSAWPLGALRRCPLARPPIIRIHTAPRPHDRPSYGCCLNHDFAELFSLFQTPVRRRRILQRKHIVDNRPHSRHAHKSQKLAKVVAASKSRTENLQMVPEHAAQICLRIGPGGRSTGNESTVLSKRRETHAPTISTHTIDNHVRSPLNRERPHLLGKITCGRIDPVVRAPVSCQLQLLITGRGDDNMRPHMFGQLQRGRPDPAANSQYDNMLSRFEFSIGDEHPPDRKKNQRKGGGFFKREVRWYGKAVLRRQLDVFCIRALKPLAQNTQVQTQKVPVSKAELAGAAPGRRIKTDFIPDSDVFYLGTNFHDNTRTVGSQDMRQRDIHPGQSPSIPQVDMV